MHENMHLSSSALSRSINAQAEHWLRLGMLTERYPDINHSQICRLRIRAEGAGMLDERVLVTVIAIGHRILHTVACMQGLLEPGANAGFHDQSDESGFGGFAAASACACLSAAGVAARTGRNWRLRL